MNTLIVGDDRASVILLRSLLEQRGHTVRIVENAKEAWQTLRTETFSIVITSWLMADMGGLELARRIRSRSGVDNTHIILLFDEDRPADRSTATAAGADDFLTKPLDRDMVTARLNIAERLLTLKADLERKANEAERLHRELERINELNETHTEKVRAMCRDLEMANAHLKAKSITDSLTGLKNHREFQERLDDEIHRAVRYNHPLSLVMLDVDHFKRYNDAYGHPAGDEVLVRLAHILERHARETDVLARYGGEEFALILANTDRESAMAAAARFQSAIAEEVWPFHPITVSMGVSTLRLVPQTRADLITEADIALYECKGRGRNGAVHYADSREPARESMVA